MKKKICFISSVIVLALLLVGCFTERKNVVLPPLRESNNMEMTASLERHYTFEEAFEEADLVAHVQVGNWLGEGQYSTYYETEIVEQYKGDSVNKIVLLQDGSSHGTYKGYPLFIYGNEMLVFLKQASNIGYDNAYWIIGAWTTLLDVIDDGNGNCYYVDRCGMLGETIDATINVADDTNISKGLYENTLKKDKVVADIYSKSKYVYEKFNLDNLMIELENKQKY